VEGRGNGFAGGAGAEASACRRSRSPCAVARDAGAMGRGGRGGRGGRRGEVDILLESLHAEALFRNRTVASDVLRMCGREEWLREQRDFAALLFYKRAFRSLSLSLSLSLCIALSLSLSLCIDLSVCLSLFLLV